MATALDNLNTKIEALQRKTQELRKQEAAIVIEYIRGVVASYDLTQEDIFGGASKRPARVASRKTTARVPAKKERGPGAKKSSAPAAKKKTVRPVKYQDDSGNTWTGHGKRPNWYKTALESGKTEQDLLARTPA